MHVTRFCRECACFVAGPWATCRNCGHEHDRDHEAMEEPVRFRSRNAHKRRRRSIWA